MFIQAETGQKIADELKNITGRNINVINQEGQIIASTDYTRIGQIHEGALNLLRNKLPIVTIHEGDKVKGALHGINIPITFAGKTVGVIGITGNPSEVEPLSKVIQKMTELMLMNLRQQEQAAAMDRAKSMFYESWIFSDGTERQELAEHAALLNIDMQQPRIVAFIDFKPQYEQGDILPEILKSRLAEQLNRELSGDTQNFCFPSRRMMVAILCEKDQKNVARKMQRILSGMGEYFRVCYACGLSTITKDMEDLPNCYEEARLAVSAAVGQGRNTVVCYDDLSPEFIFHYIPDGVKHRLWKKILSRCTEEEIREILETVRLYFSCNGDTSAAAEKMYIHRNTMYYRIKRVKDLTGLSLQEPGSSMMLYLLTTVEKK